MFCFSFRFLSTPKIFSSPSSLLDWTLSTRNNVKVRRSLSKFLLHDQNLSQRDKYLQCCLDALRKVSSSSTEQHQKNISWANALSICQAALDVSLKQQSKKPYPQDIAALMFPIFSSSGFFWQHAISFHERFFQDVCSEQRQKMMAKKKVVSTNTNDLFLNGPSTSTSAFINCLLDCGRKDEALKAIDKYCDFVPSGHIGSMMHRICHLRKNNSSNNNHHHHADLWRRNLLLASVYLAREGNAKIENISRALEKTCSMMGIVWKLDQNAQQQQQQQQTNMIPNKNEHINLRAVEQKFRDFARQESGGEDTEKIQNLFRLSFKSSSSSSSTSSSSVRFIDSRLARSLFSLLVLGDEVTLSGQVKGDKKLLLRKCSSWIQALRIAAEISCLSSTSSSFDKTDKEEKDEEEIEKTLSQREVLGIITMVPLIFSDSSSNSLTLIQKSEIARKALSFLKMEHDSLLFQNRNNNSTSKNNFTETHQRAVLTWIRCRILALKIRILGQEQKFNLDPHLQINMSDEIEKIAKISFQSSQDKSEENQHQKNLAFTSELDFLKSELVFKTCFLNDLSLALQNSSSSSSCSVWLRSLRFCASTRSRGASVEDTKRLCSLDQFEQEAKKSRGNEKDLNLFWELVLARKLEQ